jgi:topoisomerase-4 subunit A
MMIELDDKVKILDVFPFKAGRKRILASKLGYGFLMPEEEALANRKAGKQVLTVDAAGAAFCLEATGDQMGVIGDNGKILIFPLEELPEMPRGKGVKLQAYREGGLRDAMSFNAETGGYWIDTAGRRRDWTDWQAFIGRGPGPASCRPRASRPPSGSSRNERGAAEAEGDRICRRPARLRRRGGRGGGPRPCRAPSPRRSGFSASG